MFSLFIFTLSAAATPKCVIDLNIEGMTWSARCPLRVTQALETVPDVQSVETSFKDKKSTVKAQNKTCSPEGENSLIKAVEAIGYKAEVIENKKSKS